MKDRKTGEPYINVIFGNFYEPGYGDEAFIDEGMELLSYLGYNSVMLDTKDSEDFRERYEGGKASQYVKMQEYMMKSAIEHGLTYNFLLLYLNGDNLYPHIRYSPPVLGEGIEYLDGTKAGWYKYWSKKAQDTMCEHVGQILELYGENLCKTSSPNSGKVDYPICSMWDPVVAASFDIDGVERYRSFLKEAYQGNLALLNQRYELQLKSFDEIEPKDYWFGVRFNGCENYERRDRQERNSKFWIFCDNNAWKIRELANYFESMQKKLKEVKSDLFLCPDLSQWGYFLNIYGKIQCDQDNDFSDLWDTARRGIDMYALAPYLDSCHFITVPVTPDGTPDPYVVSCQHSMMRAMNPDRELIGGIYWGRYIYQDLYRVLTPEEIIGSMVSCGITGYTSYGMNGLDDGGVLNRMEEDFIESLRRGNQWCKNVIEQRKGKKKKEIALLFPLEMSNYEPFEVEDNKINRLDLLGWYEFCCDLGYQVDVISMHEIGKGELNDYWVLILPTNDCYFTAEHTSEEKLVKEWVEAGGTLLHGPADNLAERCFGIQGKSCKKTPYADKKTIIPQGCLFEKYETGKVLASYMDGVGGCIVKHSFGMGEVVSLGIQIGASYVAKNIPHVPYEQGNKEMYPLTLAGSTLLTDLLKQALPHADRKICGRGIETGIYENGMVVVNHRSTPYVLPDHIGNCLYQNKIAEEILLPHAAVWIS